MNRFALIVFGGLVAVSLGITAVLASAAFWGGAYSSRSGTQADGTVISGLVRMVRYTAADEEELGRQIAVLSAVDSKAGVSAKSYLVFNLSTGRTVISRDPERLLPVASLTKLVTAAVVRKTIDPKTKISITADVMTAYGNTAGFLPGEVFTAEDLLFPLLMVSSNDAGEAFARYYGRPQFVQAMNDFAQAVGAYRTYFADPSGLSSLNRSTAEDMALILKWIYENDREILDITMEKSKTVRRHQWINPTRFLSWSYYRGGKNGYTDEAGRTSASIFSLGRSGDTYAVVVLGSTDRDGDVARLLYDLE